MPRSSKKSIAVTHPVRTGLLAQLKAGILAYPSENAIWMGLARYQLLIGKPHPVTAAIARMHPDDQDAIDDFLLAIASRGLSLKGQFLERLVALGIARCDHPNQQEVTELLPDELLRLAKAWKKDPEKVIARLMPAGAAPNADTCTGRVADLTLGRGRSL